MLTGTYISTYLGRYLHMEHILQISGCMPVAGTDLGRVDVGMDQPACQPIVDTRPTKCTCGAV